MEVEQASEEGVSSLFSESGETSPEEDKDSGAVDLKRDSLVEGGFAELERPNHSSPRSSDGKLDPKQSPISSPQQAHSFYSQANQSRTMAHKKGSERGGFRLSEPFTLVMRLQADALVKTISHQADAEAFRKQVWNLWTNYLAITGEFGPPAWARAFQRIAKSLCKEQASYLLTPTSGRPRPEERTLACGARRARALVLAAIPFAGWGQFCDYHGGTPSGSSEASGSHPFRIPPAYEQDDTVEETVLVTPDGEASAVDGLDQDQEADLDLDETRTVQCREGENAKEEEVEEYAEPTGYIESSLLETDPGAQSWSKLSQKQKEFVQYFENTTSLTDMEDLWMDFLLDVISSEESPSSRVFWRGRLPANSRRCHLLEFNLAVLFLSSLLSFATPGRRRSDRFSCSRGYLTISALYRLCQDKSFPYLSAAAALNASPFAFLDFELFQVFRRSRPPKHSLITSITLRLADMLAVSHRPLLPLSWLVHQWLLTLGLPREAHQIATRLIGHLGAVVRRDAEVRHEDDLLLFLPNLRYLRGEVFAAAVVVVVVRLLFKLDDSFEYRWNNVSAFLSHCLRLNNAFFASPAAVYRRGKRAPLHFVWAEWAAWLEARSANRPTCDSTTQDTVSASVGPPLKSAFRMADLLPIDSAAEFLGPAEFDPSQDLGWFERSDTRRPFSEAKMKSHLSQPLRDLIGSTAACKSSAAVNYSLTAPPSPEHLSPCKLCSRYSRDSAVDADIFKRPPSISFSSCHLLLGVKRATTCHSLSELEEEVDTPPLRTFLEDLFNEAGIQKKAVFRDWMYIVKHASVYAPISNLNFVGRQNRRCPRDEYSLPQQVGRLLAEHSARVEHFLSVEGEEEEEEEEQSEEEAEAEEEEESHQSPASTAPKSKLVSEPSASLRWFLETVCMLAGVKLSDLLLEVFLVEGILFREEFSIPSRHTSHITNLALAAAFDYSVA